MLNKYFQFHHFNLNSILTLKFCKRELSVFYNQLNNLNYTTFYKTLNRERERQRENYRTHQEYFWP